MAVNVVEMPTQMVSNVAVTDTAGNRLTVIVFVFVDTQPDVSVLVTV